MSLFGKKKPEITNISQVKASVARGIRCGYASCGRPKQWCPMGSWRKGPAVGLLAALVISSLLACKPPLHHAITLWLCTCTYTHIHIYIHTLYSHSICTQTHTCSIHL